MGGSALSEIKINVDRSERLFFSGEISLCGHTPFAVTGRSDPIPSGSYDAKSESFEENELLVEKFILTVPIIQTDIPVLKRFGDLKVRLKKNNRLLPDADIFVAVALEKAEALVTGNARHFERIEGLRIENWAA